MKNYVNQENDGSDAVILQILKFRFNCVGCINAVSCTKMIWNTKVYDASLIHSTSWDCHCYLQDFQSIKISLLKSKKSSFTRSANNYYYRAQEAYSLFL